MSAIVELISWWRTYLIVDVPKDSDVVPALKAAGDTSVIHSFYHDSQESDAQRYKLNISVVSERSLLEEGEWILVDRRTSEPLVVGDEVLLQVEALNRSFFFSKGESLYSVRFVVPPCDFESSELHLIVAYYLRDRRPRRTISFAAFAKKMLNAYYKLACVFTRKRGDRIMFMSENSESLGGNLAAISNRIHERGLQSQFKISYSVRNIFGGHIKLLEWLCVLNQIAKQDVIFVDDYVPVFAAIDLSSRTKLVQVWHAGFGFKAVGFGRFGIDGSPNPFASCHRKYTYALVGNPALREIYSEVFGIEQSALLATGMPRLDHFLDEEIKKQACELFLSKYPATKDRRVILFAPTYRGADQKHAHYDFDRVDFDGLYRTCCDTDSIVVFKMHRFIRTCVPIPENYKDRFFDASNYDINELFYSTDVLITDYSSCFYDFILLGRPVLFYCYDLASYSATRGVHRPVEDVAPGKVCKTFPQLLHELEEGDIETRVPDKMLVDRCAQNPPCTASDAVIDFVLLGKEVPGICLV